MTARRRFLSAAAAAAALPLAARAAPASAAASPAADALPALPPLPLSDRRLANGLRVVGLPMPGLGTVAVQVWYRVGGKDDPPGRSGFAHLFEHLMFKRTARLPDEAFDRLTEDVGGSNNAFTAADTTVYTEEVPANHLERLLWAEAERMNSLQVDEANFRSERSVVEEELRERVEADPYGRLFEALPTLAYLRHPYKRPVIGSIADLEAATLADVRRFHATFYRPDNAVLIVAGGVEAAELDRLVDRHFGPLKAPAIPIPRVDVDEPRRREPKRVTLHAPIVPLPALAIVWQGPRAGAADAPALQVASALLSQGESSRLTESLVYRDRLAQSAGFWTDLNADAGMLVAYAIAAGGRGLPALETAMQAQIRRLATGPITAAELDKVRTQLQTAVVAARQTPPGVAEAAGWAIVNHGDPHEADREIERLQAVTADDVQRVLKRHLLDRPAVTVHYSADRKGGAK